MSPLTRRQQEVLVLTSLGYSAKEAAVELGIGYQTVKFHRRDIHQRLGARTSSESVAIAFQRGLLR